MLHHTVMIRVVEDATEEQIEALADKIRSVAAEIALHDYYSVGENISPRTGGYTLCLHSGFADEDTLQQYIVHPAHQDLVKNHLDPLCADRVVSDVLD